MSKKKLKKMLRRAMKNGRDSQKMNPAADFGTPDKQGFGLPGGYALGDKSHFGKGLLSNLGLPKGFASGQTEQFIIGALLGAAAAYVLADAELRNKIMKSVMKLYAGLTGGVEEFKEQMADLKAEVEAEHGTKV